MSKHEIIRDASYCSLYCSIIASYFFFLQAEWNKLKHDVGNVDEFIASHKDKPDDSQQIPDFGLKAVSSAATRYSCDSTTVVSQSSSSYEPSVSLYYDTKLFDVLCPTVPVMTEDIKNNQSFMSCVKSAEPAVLYFVNLKKQYTHSKQRERQTVLRKDLEAIDADIDTEKTIRINIICLHKLHTGESFHLCLIRSVLFSVLMI